MPGTDGLLHVSEIANHRVKDVRDELKEGEQILVKVINIDPTGKIRLSRKALLQHEETPARKTSAGGRISGLASLLRQSAGDSSARTPELIRRARADRRAAATVTAR